MPYRDTKQARRTLTAVAVSQGGYFTARQASDAGYDAPHLTYHVSAGNFERVGHGVYRVPALPLSEHDDLIRLSLWSRGRDDRPRAIISHQTALALHDLAEFIPTTIHLTVPRGFRKPVPDGCTLHLASVDPRETETIDVLTVTTPLRTLRDLMATGTFPREQGEVAVAAAAERGLVRPQEAWELQHHAGDQRDASATRRQR